MAQSTSRVAEIARAGAENLAPDADLTSARPAVGIHAPEYVVGEADVLRINVWKEPEISQPSISVQPDGMISVPLVGIVHVSNMTVSQIEEMLTTKLRRFIDKPQVTVTVVEVKSKSVYLTGEVSRPGVYSLLSTTNVVQLVVRAGGLTPFAHRSSVVVLRNTNGVQERLKVNLTKVLRGDAPEQNIQLMPSDVVVVP
jgi:polysaccharide export outer membrane protein